MDEDNPSFHIRRYPVEPFIHCTVVRVISLPVCIKYDCERPHPSARWHQFGGQEASMCGDDAVLR